MTRWHAKGYGTDDEPRDGTAWIVDNLMLNMQTLTLTLLKKIFIEALKKILNDPGQYCLEKKNKKQKTSILQPSPGESWNTLEF